MKEFEVIDFRFIETTDAIDKKYLENWSRPYEYKYVTDFIMMHKYKDFSIPEIHNTSWGGQFNVHVIFRDELDKIGKCIHSDIVAIPPRKTHYYDITTENKEFEEKFDFVLNVSVIEHLKTNSERLTAVENLFKQVKPNGYLVMTFDYPVVDLNEIEILVDRKCDVSRNRLNGINGFTQAPPVFKNLNILILTIKKNNNN